MGVFTKDNAREMQLRGAAKRSENAEKRRDDPMMLVRSIRKAFNGLMPVPAELEKLAESAEMEIDYNKRIRALERATLQCVKRLAEEGDVDSLAKIATIGGLDFESSPEGRGGEQNPVHEEIVFRMA